MARRPKIDFSPVKIRFLGLGPCEPMKRYQRITLDLQNPWRQGVAIRSYRSMLDDYQCIGLKETMGERY